MTFKFWELRNRLRRALSLKNRTIFVLERIMEESGESFNDVIEDVIVSSPVYVDKVDKLKGDYPDIHDIKELKGKILLSD